MRRALVFLLVAITPSCGQPSAPSGQSVRVTTLRYQRIYPPSTAEAGRMYIEMSIPIAGENTGRTNILLCFPTQTPDGSFVCDSVGWDVPVNLEAWVNVYDPTLGRHIASAVFVNGQ